MLLWPVLAHCCIRQVYRVGKVGLRPSILYPMARACWEMDAVGQRRHYM